MEAVIETIKAKIVQLSNFDNVLIDKQLEQHKIALGILDAYYSHTVNMIEHLINKTPEERILIAVSLFQNVTIEDMKSKSRLRENVTARQRAMYFLKENTKHALRKIGSHFNGKDHSTVIHAIDNVENLMFSDKYYKKEMEELKVIVKAAYNFNEKICL